jgi:hypothetical protein
LDLESGKLSRQYSHIPFEPVLVKMDVECESMIEPMVVDQRETRAIDKAKVFVIVTHENRLRGLLNRIGYAKYFDSRPVERVHEFDSRFVADFEANQRVRFAKNEIGRYKLRF